MDLEAGDVAVWVGPRRRQRHVRHRRRARRQLHAGLVGRAAGLQPQHDQRHRRDGETVDMGQLPLNGWWTEYERLRLQRRQPQRRMDWNDATATVPDAGEGELGVPNFTLTLRHRENNLYDRGQNTAATDACGHYYFESGYPIGEWTIMEAYSDSTTRPGSPTRPTTSRRRRRSRAPGSTSASSRSSASAARVDWGVHAYDAERRHQRRRPATTAASSARSATTRPATSSTRSTSRPRTGSPASPACRSSCTRRSPAGRRRRRHGPPVAAVPAGRRGQR